MSCSGSRPSQPPCLRPRMPLGTAVTLARHVLPADTQGCAQGGPLHPQACPPPSAGNTVAFPAAGWGPGRTAAPQAKALPSQQRAAGPPAPGSCLLAPAPGKLTLPLRESLCPYYTEAIFVRGVGEEGPLCLCVCLGWGRGRAQGGDRISL
uniref:Uncharacterized protein n=1 Tax=Myotis myotis TaxID=51298 RepID=A0A7J7SR34_MYOMY|nr:hypothetical protein mMyoMyo1_009302 [Myotis myotis]